MGGISVAGKGILAADESTGTIGKRFKDINVENNVENARAYRELLFTAPGIENHISGVILFEQTVGQATSDGKNFVELLRSRGIYAGIKLDKGPVDIGGTNGEKATQGLDGLAARCQDFYARGCRFAKWRAILKIGDGMPSELSVNETAHTLARYGSICQDHGLVPIIEPEILMDGAHTIEKCAEVSEHVFSTVMKALIDHKLVLEGTLLKPNMVTPGQGCPDQKSPEEVASRNLNAMNKITEIQRPWALSFSYGRALQQSVLQAWKGDSANVAAAQAALLERARANGAATLGEYQGGSGA